MPSDDPPAVGRGWRWLAHAPHVWWQLRLWAFLMMRLRVTGREHVREEEPAVYVGKHASHYDLFLMLAALRGFQRGSVVVASWHRMLSMPLLGPMLRGLDTVPVDPRPGQEAQRTLALRTLVRHVREGRSVVVFPEGRRNDHLGAFGTGAAVVALQCGVPVAPFAIRGALPLFRNVGRPDRWTGRVTVEFLPRFDPRALARDLEAKGASLDERLEAVCQEMRRRIGAAIDYPVEGAPGVNGPDCARNAPG